MLKCEWLWLLRISDPKSVVMGSSTFEMGLAFVSEAIRVVDPCSSLELGEWIWESIDTALKFEGFDVALSKDLAFSLVRGPWRVLKMTSSSWPFAW